MVRNRQRKKTRFFSNSDLAHFSFKEATGYDYGNNPRIWRNIHIWYAYSVESKVILLEDKPLTMFVFYIVNIKTSF